MKKSIVTYVIVFLAALLMITIFELTKAEPSVPPIETQTMPAPPTSALASPDDLQFIIQYLYAHRDRADDGFVDNPMGIPIFSTQQRFKEKLLPPHNDYWWEWNEHITYIHYLKPNHTILLAVTIKHVECTADTLKAIVFWRFFDYDMDGKIDNWHRDFVVEPDDTEGNYITPKYPDGFVNRSWYNPSREEAQLEFNEAVKTWVKHLKTVGGNGASH